MTVRLGGTSLRRTEEISEDWGDGQGVPILGDIAGCLSFRGGGAGLEANVSQNFQSRACVSWPNFSGWALEGKPVGGRLRGE